MSQHSITAGSSFPGPNSRSRAVAATRCSGCGRRPETGGDAADLAIVWLIAHPGPVDPSSAPAETGRTGDAGAEVVEARYCRGCAPTDGPVADMACADCGDGPLLAGALAVDDLLTTAAVDTWLEAVGWRCAGPWCPWCAPLQQLPGPL